MPVTLPLSWKFPCEENLTGVLHKPGFRDTVEKFGLGCRYEGVRKERGMARVKFPFHSKPASPVEGKTVTRWNMFLVFQKSQRKKVMKSNIQKTLLLLSDQARSEQMSS